MLVGIMCPNLLKFPRDVCISISLWECQAFRSLNKGVFLCFFFFPSPNPSWILGSLQILLIVSYKGNLIVTMEEEKILDRSLWREYEANLWKQFSVRGEDWLWWSLNWRCWQLETLHQSKPIGAWNGTAPARRLLVGCRVAGWLG
jgi:hypothetical protein